MMQLNCLLGELNVAELHACYNVAELYKVEPGNSGARVIWYFRTNNFLVNRKIA